MSNVKIVNDDFRNQVLPKELESVDTQNNQCIWDNEYKNETNPEDYIQGEIDAQIEEYDTQNSLEDIYPCIVIDVDDFIFELVCELKKRLDQSKIGSHQTDNTATIQKYENWISILNYIDGFITPQELDVLAECISTYASVCYPYERRKEIRRNLWYQNSWFDIDLLEFESKIYRIDVQVLYELTEILVELESLFFCTTNSDNNHHSSFGKHDWPISTFYFLWETFNIDSVQWYEIQAELSWANAGLIQDIWNSDHVIFIMDEHNAISTEYDYYVNQFNDSAQQNIDKIDLGELECLIEDDLFKETWLLAGMEYPNLIDYFWEAEITELCQNKDGGFHTDYHDGFSEHEYCNYSKFHCYNGDSGFFYCNKDSCEGCTQSSNEKSINQQYVLWEKYVQPSNPDEYFDPKAY